MSHKPTADEPSAEQRAGIEGLRDEARARKLAGLAARLRPTRAIGPPRRGRIDDDNPEDGYPPTPVAAPGPCLG
jgi:hypothetical protein